MNARVTLLVPCNELPLVEVHPTASPGLLSKKVRDEVRDLGLKRGRRRTRWEVDPSTEVTIGRVGERRLPLELLVDWVPEVGVLEHALVGVCSSVREKGAGCIAEEGGEVGRVADRASGGRSGRRMDRKVEHVGLEEEGLDESGRVLWEGLRGVPSFAAMLLDRQLGSTGKPTGTAVLLATQAAVPLLNLDTLNRRLELA